MCCGLRSDLRGKGKSSKVRAVRQESIAPFVEAIEFDSSAVWNSEAKIKTRDLKLDSAPRGQNALVWSSRPWMSWVLATVIESECAPERRYVVEDRVVTIESNLDVAGADPGVWADNVARLRVAADDKVGTGLPGGVGKG